MMYLSQNLFSQVLTTKVCTSVNYRHCNDILKVLVPTDGRGFFSFNNMYDITKLRREK